MNLSDLKDVLGVRDIRTAPGQPPIESEGPTLVQEIFARHRNSTQPESQQLCIILSAVLEVIKGEGLQPTPTALFAALMSSLEKPDTAGSVEITAGVCNLLSQVLPRVPNSVLSSKSTPAMQLIMKILDTMGSETIVARSALPCLIQLLSGAKITDWTPAAPAFAVVLRASMETRPKIRKRAQSGVGDILAALQNSPNALNGASEMILQVCQKVLPGPEAAARAAADAPNKKRQQAEEAIAAAVTDALHLIGLLKHCAAFISGSSASSVVDLLLQLYTLRQPLLSQGTTDILTQLCSSPSSNLTTKGLSSLLQVVIGGDVLNGVRDASTALGFTRLIEVACIRLYGVDAAACSNALPHAIHALIPLLASEHDSVRMSTTDALCTLLANCISPGDVAAAASGRATKGRALPALVRTIAAVESCLGPQYQDSWAAGLPVAAEAMNVLGRQGAEMAVGLVSRVGALCAGVDDAAEMEADIDDQLVLAAQATLGAALRSLGPEFVLDTLPLGLEEGLDGTGEARTWLLPLLRQHVRGARLGYWTSNLLPLARTMGNRAVHAEKFPAKQKEAKVCAALEQQIWATLPSFCSWAEDVPEAFKELSKPMSAAFQKRAEFRTIICNSFTRLCKQARAAARHHGKTVGHADPSSLKDDENRYELAEEELVHTEVPDTITLEMAENAIEALSDASSTWLPILLDAFVTASPERRTQLEAAISSFACICHQSVLAGPFRSAITQMINATREAQEDDGGFIGDSPTEKRCTYMEASLALAGGLESDALQVLYKAASQSIEEKDPAIQKKAYKILAYLCEARTDFLEAHFSTILQALTAGMATSVSAAKRYRLRCLKAVILRLTEVEGEALELGTDFADAADGSQQARQVVASMVSEIVLCVKEANKRTRAEAYTLLIEVATAMHEADPPPAHAYGGMHSDDDDMAGAAAVGRSDEGGLHALFTMVLGGLVGSTPHMISASVMALARLLYDFAPVLTGLVPDLLPAVLILLRSKAREVIKSVLGFLKVVVVRLPVEELQPFIPSILEGILLWAEDSKNKFRLKVRVIIERLARRCGFEAVEPHVPQSHRALIVHIRKQKTRKDKKKSESHMDWEEDDDEAAMTRSRKTGMTGRWTEGVFSEEGSEEGAKTMGGKTKTTRRDTASRKSVKTQHTARLPSGGDVVDLLDPSTSRRLVKAAAGVSTAKTARAATDDVEFEMSKDGRLIIKDDEPAGGKRKRNDGFDSDDSDFEDLKGFSGMSLALKGSKSVRMAPSIAASIGGRSMGAKTMGGKSMSGRSRKTEGGRSAPAHTGDRFKPKKGKSGGDVKGGSKVEPYAYWPLDRKLLNRRQQKTKDAKKGLDKIVNAAKDGAAKGRKAKRARR